MHYKIDNVQKREKERVTAWNQHWETTLGESIRELTSFVMEQELFDV